MPEHLTGEQIRAVVDEINAYFARSILYRDYSVAMLYRYLDVTQEMYCVHARRHEKPGLFDLAVIRVNGRLTIAACGELLYTDTEGVYPDRQMKARAAMTDKPIFYTVCEEQGHGFSALILSHTARLLRHAPTQSGFFGTFGQAEAEAWALTGGKQPLTFLTNAEFARLYDDDVLPQSVPVGGECQRCGCFVYSVCQECGGFYCLWHLEAAGGRSLCLSCWLECEVRV